MRVGRGAGAQPEAKTVEPAPRITCAKELLTHEGQDRARAIRQNH
jgi:hypothetical protein